MRPSSKKTLGLSFPVILAAALIAVFIAAPAARAAVDLTPLDQKLNSMINGLEFEDIDLATALHVLAVDKNLNILISDKVRGKKIGIRLYNVSLRTALKEILKMAGADMDIDPANNIINVYSEDEMKEIKAPPLVQAKEAEVKTTIYRPIFASSDALKPILEPYLSEKGRIQLYKETRNSGTIKPEVIIITDKPEIIAQIVQLIKSLDTETRQVLIQTKMVETELSNQELMGVNWSMGGSLIGPPFKFDAGEMGKVRLGTLSFADFKAVIDRLSSAGKSNILSDTSLATLDGESATFHVGDQIPVGVNTVGSGGGGTVSFGTTGVNNTNVGIQLSVTPHILSDQLVYINITPTVSEVSSFTALGGTTGGTAPVVKERTANTNLIVRSGETIVIGGLVQDQVTETTTKVPILGDLPIVGGAFRHKDSKVSKSDLLIFVTATIMEKRMQPQDEDAAAPAAQTDVQAKENPLK